MRNEKTLSERIRELAEKQANPIHESWEYRLPARYMKVVVGEHEVRRALESPEPFWTLPA